MAQIEKTNMEKIMKDNNTLFLRVGDVVLNYAHIETVDLNAWAVDKRRYPDGNGEAEECVTVRMGRSLARYTREGVPQSSMASTYNFFGEAAKALQALWDADERVLDLGKWWKERKTAEEKGGRETGLVEKPAGKSDAPAPPPRLKKLG